MEARFNMQHAEPQALKAMYGLEAYLQTTSLDKQHKHLIKIRASQINGCAFCIDMHTKEALSDGESMQRIFLLNAWRETNLYSEEERLLLEITEAVTLISQGGISTDLYSRAEAILGQNYLAQAIMATITINAWNRIAISTHLQPGANG